MKDLISSKVPNDMRESLIWLVSIVKVRVAMFSIKGDKFPRPDGYNAEFFHKNWDIVGSSPDFGS